MQAETNPTDHAIQFINSTSSHIFLTGKAGTGKTTFLKNLAQRTHKTMTIVAPTGIAALNAEGVTIHSQFLFPLGTFSPDKSLAADYSSQQNFYTQNTLARKHPLNSVRRQVLRSIDLLVIDEVSMLRADLLDAIDYRLKSARGNFRQNFGGVQLLLIGDLFQLPPVVKQSDVRMMQKYYSSSWFYESKALKEDGLIYIELDKIFRQHDDAFIDILNNLRNNTTTARDIEILNQHYRSEEEIQSLDEVITLTTHNYKADELNLKALRNLDAPSHYFDANVEGEFPESMYPASDKLELKEGAQVMFIRNDTEDQAYFNGKLATVGSIEGSKVSVIMAGSGEEYELRKQRWENKRYSIDSTTRDLVEEVVGTFDQFPIKLAWAITVHKSQGLTFDKAIIDVGQAFADGQVYVALSRLRSLDGLILRTRINPSVISTDRQIVSFAQANHNPANLAGIMKKKQLDFIHQIIDRTFDFESLVREIQHINKSRNEAATLAEDSMQPILDQLAGKLTAEKENTMRFRRQLQGLLQNQDTTTLLDRIKKGTEYYRKFLFENLEILLRHVQEMKQHKRVKTYLNHLEELDQLVMKRIEEIDKALLLTEGILQGEYNFDFTSRLILRKEERNAILREISKHIPEKAAKPKQSKKSKKDPDGLSTYDLTLKMFNGGMTVNEIAKERQLVSGTIEGHLAKAVESGLISIFTFTTEEEVTEVAAAIKDLPEKFSPKELRDKLKGKYSYGKLRAVTSHLQPKEQAE